jgi:hypothetical protein
MNIMRPPTIYKKSELHVYNLLLLMAFKQVFLSPDTVNSDPFYSHSGYISKDKFDSHNYLLKNFSIFSCLLVSKLLTWHSEPSNIKSQPSVSDFFQTYFLHAPLGTAKLDSLTFYKHFSFLFSHCFFTWKDFRPSPSTRMIKCIIMKNTYGEAGFPVHLYTLVTGIRKQRPNKQ